VGDDGESTVISFRNATIARYSRRGGDLKYDTASRREYGRGDDEPDPRTRRGRALGGRGPAKRCSAGYWRSGARGILRGDRQRMVAREGGELTSHARGAPAGTRDGVRWRICATPAVDAGPVPLGADRLIPRCPGQPEPTTPPYDWSATLMITDSGPRPGCSWGGLSERGPRSYPLPARPGTTPTGGRRLYPRMLRRARLRPPAWRWAIVVAFGTRACCPSTSRWSRRAADRWRSRSTAWRRRRLSRVRPGYPCKSGWKLSDPRPRGGQGIVIAVGSNAYLVAALPDTRCSPSAPVVAAPAGPVAAPVGPARSAEGSDARGDLSRPRDTGLAGGPRTAGDAGTSPWPALGGLAGFGFLQLLPLRARGVTDPVRYPTSGASVTMGRSLVLLPRALSIARYPRSAHCPWIRATGTPCGHHNDLATRATASASPVVAWVGLIAAPVVARALRRGSRRHRAEPQPCRCSSVATKFAVGQVAATQSAVQRQPTDTAIPCEGERGSEALLA